MRHFGFAAVLAGALLGHGPAVHAEASAASPAPVCLYGGKSYSSGAFICVQKALMLTCAADAPQPSWKVVPDGELSSRCMGPAASAAAPSPARAHRRVAHHRRAVARAQPAVSSKCFLFNGRQYCE